ncbi:MAG: hypothetical protein ACE5DN_06185, partial [Flavobacteriales bacterium]
MKIKIIKKAVKILLRAFAVFITLLLIMLFALRFDTVQTGLAHIISGRLSSATGAEIKVDRLQIKLIKTLALQNLLVRDLHRDTLLFIPELDVSLSAFDYGMKTLDFNKITIENPRIYLGKHKGEEELNLQFMLDYFSSNDTAASALWHMEASEITITNGRFIFLDENAKGKRQQGIDYGDIAISHFNLLINDVLLDGDSMSAGLGNLSFKEHSGFELHSMNGIFSLTPRQIGIAGMKLAAGRSSLISDVSMHFGKFSDFNDFIHSVKMHVDIKQADIYTSDIAAFAPALYGADHRFRISGRVRGSVDRLRAKDLELQFGPNSYLKGDADITGLPVPDETFVMMKIRELLTNKRDLDSLPLPPFSQKRKLMLPPAFANLGRMTFSGDFTGFMNDFVAYGRFSTALGGISSDIQLYSDTLDGLMRYEGKMAMHDFDIGRLTGDQAGTLGKLSCTLNVQGTGTSAAHLQATLNGHISRLDLMQYSYSNMELKGRIDGKKFFGEGKMRDPNIALDFRGGVEMNPKQMF